MDNDWGHWLAGFVDGEGTFTIERQHRAKNAYLCFFGIGLRRDDLETLESIRDTLGVGNIYFLHQRTSPGAQPQARYKVQSRSSAGVIRDVFRRYPLRSKKQRDFEIWARAVDLWLAEPTTRKRGSVYAAAMGELRRELVTVRRYPGSGKLAAAAFGEWLEATGS